MYRVSNGTSGVADNARPAIKIRRARPASAGSAVIVAAIPATARALERGAQNALTKDWEHGAGRTGGPVPTPGNDQTVNHRVSQKVPQDGTNTAASWRF